MAKPKALVLRAAGSNCDQETEFALQQAGAEAERVHINRFLDKDKPRRLEEFDVLVIPGGFTYADDIGAGRVLANKIRHHLSDDLAAFVAAGKPLLGICNGFQILLDLGLLNVQEKRSASLTNNDNGLFECRWSSLKVNFDSACRYLDGLDAVVKYPVAHGEGKFLTGFDSLSAFESKKRVVFRYQTPALKSFPHNPNGSDGDIAGICDATGVILGLMPHPERALARRQDPHTVAMGRRLFENIVLYAGKQ